MSRPAAALACTLTILCLSGAFPAASAHGEEEPAAPFTSATVATFEGEAGDVDVEMDEDGGIHATWVEAASGTLRYRHLPSGANAWSPTERVSSNASDAALGVVAGNPYILFRDTSEAAGDGRLVLAYREDDGIWLASVADTAPGTGHHIAVDASEAALHTAWVTQGAGDDGEDVLHYMVWVFENGTIEPFGSGDRLDTEIRGKLRDTTIVANDAGAGAIIVQDDDEGWIAHSRLEASQPARVLHKALPTLNTEPLISPRVWGPGALVLDPATGVTEGPYVYAGSDDHLTVRLASSAGITWRSRSLDLMGHIGEAPATPVAARDDSGRIHMVWSRALDDHDPIGGGLTYMLLGGVPSERQMAGIGVFDEALGGAQALAMTIGDDDAHVLVGQPTASDGTVMTLRSASLADILSWMEGTTQEHGLTPHFGALVEPSAEEPAEATDDSPGVPSLLVVAAVLSGLFLARRRTVT